jgi:hypothetical protein
VPSTSVAASVQNATAHAADYAVAAADDSVSSYDCRSMNDGRTVRADAAGTNDTACTDDRLGVIGTPCHRDDKMPMATAERISIRINVPSWLFTRFHGTARTARSGPVKRPDMGIDRIHRLTVRIGLLPL